VVAQEELFRKGYPLGWIEVTMIANMRASACLSNEERADTVTKRFFVLPSLSLDSNTAKASPWWGTWEGYNTEAPNDKFTVSWGYTYLSTTAGFTRTEMDFCGLPKGIGKQLPFYTRKLSKMSGTSVHVGYKALLLRDRLGQHWDFTGFSLDAVCYRNGNDITMEYSYNNTPYQLWLNGEERQTEPIVRINKTFIATKISNEVLTEE